MQPIALHLNCVALQIHTHPLHNVKRMSGLVQMYSTVGVRVPICRRTMLVKICTASFLPSKSTLQERKAGKFGYGACTTLCENALQICTQLQDCCKIALVSKHH